MPNPLLIRKLYSPPRRFTFTATTTGATETVTVAKLTTSYAQRIDWGDRLSDILPANSEAAITHVYASAGTYNVTVRDARAITQLQMNDAKLGGLNTAELRYSKLTFFYVTLITGSTVRSSDMADWRPTLWRLSYMPTGTYAIDSSDMADWRPTDWWLYSMPAGTYAIDSADMVDWRPTSKIVKGSK